MNPVRIFWVLNSAVTIDNILPSMRPVTNWQYLVMSMWRMDDVLWQFYIPELFCTLWPEPWVERRPILMERYNFPMWLAEYWLNEFYSILKYLTIKPPLQIWAGQEVRSSGASATFQKRECSLIGRSNRYVYNIHITTTNRASSPIVADAMQQFYWTQVPPIGYFAIFNYFLDWLQSPLLT